MPRAIQIQTSPQKVPKQVDDPADHSVNVLERTFMDAFHVT